MKCEICGLRAHFGVSLYRQNALGEVGRWRCREHNDAPVDAEVQRLVDVLEAPAQEKNDG